MSNKDDIFRWIVYLYSLFMDVQEATKHAQLLQYEAVFG